MQRTDPYELYTSGRIKRQYDVHFSELFDLKHVGRYIIIYLRTLILLSYIIFFDEKLLLVRSNQRVFFSLVRIGTCSRYFSNIFSPSSEKTILSGTLQSVLPVVRFDFRPKRVNKTQSTACVRDDNNKICDVCAKSNARVC